jgi:hypothetical protein
MFRASLTRVVYSVCGVLLGSFALLIFVTKFDYWASGWGLYEHLLMFGAAVGSIACLKAARMSFATPDKRPHEPIGPRT